jgi:hypothetical protein
MRFAGFSGGMTNDRVSFNGRGLFFSSYFDWFSCLQKNKEDA